MPLGRQTVTLTLAGSLMLATAVPFAPAGASQADPATTPVADECEVAPLGSPVWDGEEVAEPTAPVSIDGPFTPPTGTPVDDETLAGVTATVAEAIACQNAGDIARTLALFTPDAVRGFFSGPRGFDAEAVDEAIANGPDPVPSEEVISLVSVDGVETLPDGRVGATVTTSAGDIEYVDFLFFVEDTTPDGSNRWLIDGSVAIDGQTQVSGGATPIP